MRFVDKLCLEKFVDGLEEPFANHVGLMQPTTLNQALQYAIDKANKIARKTGQYDVGKQQQKPIIPPQNNYHTKPLIPQPTINRHFTPQIPQKRPLYNNFNNRPIPLEINQRPTQNSRPYLQQNRQLYNP